MDSLDHGRGMRDEGLFFRLKGRNLGSRRWWCSRLKAFGDPDSPSPARSSFHSTSAPHPKPGKKCTRRSTRSPGPSGNSGPQAAHKQRKTTRAPPRTEPRHPPHPPVVVPTLSPPRPFFLKTRAAPPGSPAGSPTCWGGLGTGRPGTLWPSGGRRRRRGAFECGFPVRGSEVCVLVCV